MNEINQRREANWGGDVAMRWERKMMSDRGLPTANEGLSPSTFASAFKMSKCECDFKWNRASIQKAGVVRAGVK